MGFHGFSWVIMGKDGFYSDFTGFFWALLSFTGLYLVLLGFTRFHGVLLGYRWVLLDFNAFF